MGLAIAIILGIIGVTAISATFDYLGKRAKGVSGDVARKIDELEYKVRALESAATTKDDELRQLEHKVEFLDRLLEDKSKK